MSLVFRRFGLLAALALLAAFAPIAGPAAAAGPYIVTKTADTNGTCASGSNCSLREAISAANAAPGEIQFNIPTNDAGYQAAGGYWRITVQGSALPALSGGGITINGLGGDGKPKIEISGGGVLGRQGLLITSANNTVKGLIINSFIATPQGGYGIWLSGAAATGNTITQNYIGTNGTGSAAAGGNASNNTGGGVALQFGASNNTIDNNTISGNGGYGVYLFTSVFFSTTDRQTANVIKNNRIGVSADGSSAIGNRSSGVYVGDNSPDTQVGPGNVISGNGAAGADTVFGVNVGGYQGSDTTYLSGTRVIGNRIGTNAAGTAALPNAGGGVLVTSSDATVIGGPSGNPATPGGDGNLISGNTNSGVLVKDSPAFGSGTTNIQIENNWIGLNASGTGALPNTDAGVYLSTSANTIKIGPNNSISGNATDGVLIEAEANRSGQPAVPNARQVRQNTITGNYIGTDASGNAAVPNGRYGIQLLGGTFANVLSNNRIANNPTGGVYLAADAGTPPAAPTQNKISGNTIKANGAVGITLTAGSNNNIVGQSDAGAGNTIESHSSSGVEIQSSGNTLKANEVRLNQIGITINGAANNTIGGATAAEGNVLHNNTLHGIFINGSGATGNRVSHTTTYANGGKGIALASGGNAPIVGATISATPPSSGFTLSGTVSGCAAPGCTVEIFTDDSPPGDEGPAFLASTQPGNGGAFSVDISGCKHYLIFTLSDAANNTSEFIGATGTIAQCVPSAPGVQITTADPQPPRSVSPGATTIYTHTVTNIGSGTGAVTVDLSQSPNSWATLINNDCAGKTLAPQASCTFALQVSVPANAQAGDFNQSTITVSIGAASKQQVDRTNVLSQAGLTFTPYPTPGSNAKTTVPGQPVSYQHQLTNTGNGPDSFTITAAPPAGWGYALAPTSVSNLQPNASALVTLVLTPTNGISSPPDYEATVTASSVANPSASASITDTTTITSSAVPEITGSLVTPPSVDPGAQVDVAYTVKNAGNLSGTFDLQLAPPAGWSVLVPISSTVALTTGASIVVSATLQVPQGALGGAYPVKLTATDQANPGASASLAAIVNVNKRAALTLGPDIDDPTPRAPGQVVTYTATLQNAGNFTDTVSLAASSSRGWPLQITPSAPAVGPGASQPITIALSIPPGQPALPANIATITATSSLPAVQASMQITTTLAAVAAADLTPDTQTQQLIDTKPVTFSFTLRNTGSITQSYALDAANVPAGWQSTLAPTETQVLQPNETVSVTLVLSAPAGQPNGQQFTILVNASCRENSCGGDSAQAIVRTGPPVQIGGTCDVSARPGATVTCLHQLTNSSGVTDTFVLTPISLLGWRATLSPQIVVLGPGATRSFTATTTVPPATAAGVAERLKISAKSTGAPGTVREVVDTITVLQFARLSFVASQGRPLVPGQTLTFRHQLVNTGNNNDAFTITTTQQLNWNVTVTPTTTAALAPGFTYPVTVIVEVPNGTAVTTVNSITVRATSVFSPTVYDEVVDIVGVQRAPSTLMYFPIAQQ